MHSVRAMVISLLLAWGLMACERGETPAATLAKSASPCELTVGWDPWEPYQYEDADGSVRGLDIEIMQQLAADAGCRLRFKKGNWSDLLADLKQGSVQVLLSATPLAERRTYAHFSPPYRSETFALYSRAEDADALRGQALSQLVLEGRRIGIVDDYYYGEVASQLIHGEVTRGAFVPATMVEINYGRLLSGEIDALLDDPFVAAAVLRRKGMTERVVRHPLEISSNEVSIMYSRAGVPEALAQKLDAALTLRKGNGTLQALIDKYRS